MDFEKLGLSSDYAARLKSQGISEATWIQNECFESILNGQSVMGLAKTGTGKTLAFLAPLVERLSRQNCSAPGSVVVLLPTRELALQVAESLQILLDDSNASVVMVGGQAEDAQLAASKKATWWIATPGRFLDLLRRRQLPKIESLKCVILDEADRLLDMGFLDDIRAIFKQLPPSEQALFFSATLHFGVEEMAFEMGFDFVKKGTPAEEATAENLDHSVVFLGEKEKFAYLNLLLHQNKGVQAIIFSNYKDKARKIAGRMRGLGAKAECLNADLPQSRRIQIVDGFKKKRVQYLVASDLAARGIDIENLDLVVNYDLPEDPSIYVHRVGRTARAGKKGKAVSFVGFEDSFRLERLEKFIGQKLNKDDVPEDFSEEKVQRWERDKSEQQGSEPRDGRGPREGSDRATSHSRHKRSDNRSRPQHDRHGSRKPYSKQENQNQGRSQSKPLKKESLLKRIFRKLLGSVITLEEDIKTPASKKDGEQKKRHHKHRRHGSKQGGSRRGRGNNRSGSQSGKSKNYSGNKGKKRHSKHSGSRPPSSSSSSRPSSGRGPSGSSK